MRRDNGLRRAARAGRRVLKRTLSAGLFGWIEKLNDEAKMSGELHAMSGLLAQIGVSLETAYQNSGEQVRKLIWSLHRQFNPKTMESETLLMELKEFSPWIQTRLAHGSDGDSIFHKILFQWIEVANERLTMRRYARGERRREHGRALIAAPWMAIVGESEGIDSDKGQSVLVFTEDVLLFWDHLDARRQAELGRNRIAVSPAGDFGGFYSLSEGVQPPTEEEIALSLHNLRDRLGSFDAASLPSPMVEAAPKIIREMRETIEERLDSGDWPDRFQILPPKSQHGRVPWWRKIKKG